MTWNEELRATPECISIERFDEGLTNAERDHLAHCVRCETEFALWQEFRDATPTADEGAAVQWIAAEVARRRAGNPSPAHARRSWFHLFGLQTLAAAAAVVIVGLTLSQLIVDREPAVTPTGAGVETYRSGRLEIISPTGDLREAPTEFRWIAVPAAARYDVVVLEVDRTILWRASTREPRLALGPDVIAQLVPGKTLLWEVTARGGDDTILAQSGTQRFRVDINPQRPQGDQP